MKTENVYPIKAKRFEMFCEGVIGVKLSKWQKDFVRQIHISIATKDFTGGGFTGGKDEKDTDN